MKLSISKNISLPVDVVTQKLAFLGRTGGGKTYAAMKLCELMLELLAQVVIFDPVGKWHGLRLMKDGKTKGYPIPVFGGLYGDLPLEPGAGALIAELIVSRGISCVIDVSQFEYDSDKVRFAVAFSEKFFFLKKANPSAVHLFIEEAQEFIPQNPQKGEEKMLHHFQRIWKLGRNFGIGGSLISQRPQEINKKVLNQTECLFAFQMTGPHEKKAIKEWIGDKGLDESLIDTLPALKQGYCHIWSPSWLNVSEVIKISEKKTIDVSATPTVGKKAKTLSLSPIDMKEIAKSMAATIEIAKKNDPKALQKEINELKLQLSKTNLHAKATVNSRAVQSSDSIDKLKGEKAALFDDYKKALQQIDKLKKANKLFDDFIITLLKSVSKLKDASFVWGKDSVYPVKLINKEITPIIVERSKSSYDDGSVKGDEQKFQLVDTSKGRVVKTIDHGDLDSPCQRSILNVLAQRVETRSNKKQIAIFSGYSANSGGFNDALSKLKQKEFIESQSGLYNITAKGRIAAGDVPALPQGEELLQYWVKKVNPCQGKILSTLFEFKDRDIDKTELAGLTGYSSNSGGFNDALSKLKIMDLIESEKGIFKASDVFFENELA